MNIECSSVIASVVVHARGALVTREVELPATLPDGEVDVVVRGITRMARRGSARAALDGSDRVVAAVHTALAVPRTEDEPGRSLARVRDLSARLERVGDELRLSSERRARLAELALAPRLRAFDGKRERDAFDVRFGEALEMSALVASKVGPLDERILGLEREQRELARELEAARLEDSQASTRARAGASCPDRTVTARLLGGGRPGRLLVTYAVAAARWWPAYTLRVEGAGVDPRATWTFEAIVAQRTGEDWSGVPLTLSSADLVFDARLPALPSLRFGRALPRPRRPFRPPPPGVDVMFVAYAVSGIRAFAPEEGPLASRVEADESRAREAGSGDAFELAMAFEDGALAEAAAPLEDAPALVSRSVALGALAPAARSGGLGFGGGPPRGEAAKRRIDPAALVAPQVEPEVVPSAAWTDHDGLVLASADEPRRGRLVPRADAAGADAVEEACREIDGAADGRYRDPAESRGMFDYRYEAAGRADVPSDGRVHRVAVGVADCAVRVAWRAVPSESAEVYREAHVVNPFDTGLLGGPVDVYLDGSLLTTTSVERIDRGGELLCGMGADDRLKVARNVRVSEEASGLLRGSTAVTHAVDIELSSTIGEPVEVTILERVPVTDDRALEVELVRARPEPAVYDQADRGAPVRGGHRFDVRVAPAAKTSVELVYRLVFAQKLDVVGGNRRG